mgnify:CR=1 FL=1
MTYSIVARCPRTGEYGVGIATYSPNVGVRCPVVVPQRGAASMQAVANPNLLPLARRLMESSLSAEKIVSELLSSDPFPQSRQIHVVDVYGRAHAFTGDRNPDWCGHHVGEGYSVAGERLRALPIPADILMAADDPVIPVGEFARIVDFPNVQVELDENGDASQDDVERAKKKAEETVADGNKSVESMVSAKEKDIMDV